MILRTTLSVKFTNKTSKQRTIFFQNTLFKSNNFANSYHSYHLTETTSKLTFQDVNICVRHFPQIPQERIDLSREIAEKFGIQFLGAEQLPIQSKSTFIIEVTDQKIRLRETDSEKGVFPHKWFCDFEEGNVLTHRVKTQINIPKKSPLLRATKLSTHYLSKYVADIQQLPEEEKEKLQFNSGYDNTRILDCTAGLGEDSFLLAACGANVILLERNPIIHLLLQDGLIRAKNSKIPIVRQISKRLNLVNEPTDAITYLKSIKESPQIDKPHIIYLDPMHPTNSKKRVSLPKFKMQLARKLIGSGKRYEQDELLALSRDIALKRIVFKKPFYADEDEDPSKIASFVGRSLRYDVYSPISPISEEENPEPLTE